MPEDPSAPAGAAKAAASPSDVLNFILEHAPIRVFEVDARGTFLMNEGVNPPGGSRPGALVGIDARAAYRSFPEGLAALERALSGIDSDVRYTRDGRTYDLKLSP